MIASNKGKVQEAVQVCYEVTADNLKRETEDLVEALDFFGLQEGVIITLSYHIGNKVIRLIPVYTWMKQA